MHVPGPATTPPAVADVSASLCRLPHLLANDAGLHAVAFGFRAELMTLPAGKHGHEVDALSLVGSCWTSLVAEQKPN